MGIWFSRTAIWPLRFGPPARRKCRRGAPNRYPICFDPSGPLSKQIDSASSLPLGGFFFFFSPAPGQNPFAQARSRSIRRYSARKWAGGGDALVQWGPVCHAARRLVKVQRFQPGRCRGRAVASVIQRPGRLRVSNVRGRHGVHQIGAINRGRLQRTGVRLSLSQRSQPGRAFLAESRCAVRGWRNAGIYGTQGPTIPWHRQGFRPNGAQRFFVGIAPNSPRQHLGFDRAVSPRSPILASNKASRELMAQAKRRQERLCSSPFQPHPSRQVGAQGRVGRTALNRPTSFAPPPAEVSRFTGLPRPCEWSHGNGRRWSQRDHRFQRVLRQWPATVGRLKPPQPKYPCMPTCRCNHGCRRLASLSNL